jgi:DNA-binding response OmpR family regulator
MSKKKLQVLVVDDDMWILRMMKRILELEGFQVLAASTAEASLNILEKETPI